MHAVAGYPPVHAPLCMRLGAWVMVKRVALTGALVHLGVVYVVPRCVSAENTNNR